MKGLEKSVIQVLKRSFIKCFEKTCVMVTVKIPKIKPRAYIFQRPFLRGLFLEGLIFGGAYLRREIDWASLIV